MFNRNEAKSVFVVLLSCLAFLTSFSIVKAQGTDSPINEDDDNEDMFQMSTSHPYFELSGGMTSMSINGVSSIQDNTALALRLGFENQKRLRGTSVNGVERGILNVAWSMAPEPISTAYTIETWRFGLGSQTSFGYCFGDDGAAGVYFDVGKVPLSFYSISVDTTSASPTSSPVLDRFGDALRFGDVSNASISVRVTEAVSVTGGFEWAQAFERHLFWFWAGSSVIEGIADGVAAYFVKAVGKSSPTAVPIMHFILRNGIAMGMKTLRQDQMNWPFTSTAPLNYMTYNIGLSVVF